MITTTHTPIPGPDAYSPEWYAARFYRPDDERPVVIGASEAAAACNVSPYSSALQLYLEKRRELEVSHNTDTARRMEIGKRLEPVILDFYEDETNLILDRNHPLYFHPKWSFMAATPDAIAYSQVQPYELAKARTVDAKSSNWRMVDRTGENEHRYGTPGTDEVPLTNLFQAQQQMAVMGTTVCDFPVLIDYSLRIYHVERNEELIQQIALAEAELSERIVNNDPPEPNFQHSGTVKLLSSMHGAVAGKVAILTETEQYLWTRMEHLKQQIKTAEKEADEIKARLLYSLEDAAVGRIDGCPFEIRRTVIQDSYVTQHDVETLSRRVGQVARAGHVRLSAKRIG